MERKLAAIVAADVVGYSRLMGDDEAGTLAGLRRHREELIEPKAAQYRGRTVKLMGDGALMEFNSIVDAVVFAVEVQVAMRERNAGVAENQRIVFRIGINLGDIILEGDDIHGDGVNVAARLEGLAEPGGICLSRSARNQVRDKLDLNFEDLGEVEVKNIGRPVRVFRTVLDNKAAALVTPTVKLAVSAGRGRRPFIAIGLAMGVLLLVGAVWWRPWTPHFEPASAENMAFPLPANPSIAVMPLKNLGGDSNQEYFSDGITEDIVTTLSRVPDVYVVSSNSTFAYKNAPKPVKQVAEELGVQYVLNGAVRQENDKVRISVSLIDATTGRQIWGGRYDRPFENLFALQDEINLKVVSALYSKLGGMAGERALVRDRSTHNLKAWDYYIRANSLYRNFNHENLIRARQLWEQAVKIDPNYAAAWTMIASSHLSEMRSGWSDDPKQSYSLAKQTIERSLALDEEQPNAHTLTAYLHLYARKHDDAISKGKRALSMDPNDTGAMYALGDIMRYSGRFDEAIRLIEKAMRWNPRYPDWYLYSMGMSLLHAGRHEESIDTLSRLLERNPSYNWAHAGIAQNHMALGRPDDAKREAALELAVNPKISLSFIRKVVPYKDPELLDLIINNLREAGIPE